ETRRLLDRELGRVCAFQDLVDDGGDGAVLLDHAEGVRHQTARVHKLILPVHRDLTLGVHQFHDTSALGGEERGGEDIEHVGALDFSSLKAGTRSSGDLASIILRFSASVAAACLRVGSIRTKDRFVGSCSSATREAEGNTSLRSWNILI